MGEDVQHQTGPGAVRGRRWRRMWDRWSGGLSYLLILGALTSCAFVRANVGEPLPEERIRAIQKGVTSKGEVLEALGPPDYVGHTLAHELFQYRYGDGKLGVVLIFSRANFKTDDLYIFFTRDDVVADIIFGKRTDRVRFQFWPFGE